MDIYRQQFGKRLREARKKIPGLTQERLAEKIGVEGPSVSRWETGDDFPENSRLPNICAALGVDAAYFSNPVQIIQSPLPSWASSLEEKIELILSNYENRLKEDIVLRQEHNISEARRLEIIELKSEIQRLIDLSALLSKLSTRPRPLQDIVLGFLHNDPSRFRSLPSKIRTIASTSEKSLPCAAKTSTTSPTLL